MGSMDSWMFDKQVPYAVCLTGQLNLLMLIEEMELNNIFCFSFNTDGASFKVNNKILDKFYEIWKEWEIKTNLLLEEVRFKTIYYSTVNDYLAIKEDDKIKKKGQFLTDFELWKNKSFRVVPLALQEYFVKGGDPVEFIKNYENIFDFCIMSKAIGKLYLEMQKKSDYEVTREMLEKDGWTYGKFGWLRSPLNIHTEDNEKELSMSYIEAKRIYLENHPLHVQRLKKLVRYYLSSDSPWQLYKRGIGSTGKNTNIRLHAPNELGEIYIQYFNKYEKKEDYKIDRSQYILKTLKIIDALEKTNRAKEYINSMSKTQQLSLF